MPEYRQSVREFVLASKNSLNLETSRMRKQRR